MKKIQNAYPDRGYSKFISASSQFFFLEELLLHAQQTTGDRVNVSFSDPSKPGLVEACVETGSITVKGYSGKDFVVDGKLRVEIKENCEGFEARPKRKFFFLSL